MKRSKYTLTKSTDVGNSLTLKPLSEDNAQALYVLVDSSRVHLRKWLPWVDGTKSIDDAAIFIRIGQKQNDDSNGFHCGVWLKNELAGVLRFTQN